MKSKTQEEASDESSQGRVPTLPTSVTHALLTREATQLQWKRSETLPLGLQKATEALRLVGEVAARVARARDVSAETVKLTKADVAEALDRAQGFVTPSGKVVAQYPRSVVKQLLVEGARRALGAAGKPWVEGAAIEFASTVVERTLVVRGREAQARALAEKVKRVEARHFEWSVTPPARVPEAKVEMPRPAASPTSRRVKEVLLRTPADPQHAQTTRPTVFVPDAGAQNDADARVVTKRKGQKVDQLVEEEVAAYNRYLATRVQMDRAFLGLLRATVQDADARASIDAYLNGGNRVEGEAQWRRTFLVRYHQERVGEVEDASPATKGMLGASNRGRGA